MIKKTLFPGVKHHCIRRVAALLLAIVLSSCASSQKISEPFHYSG
jgi:hypothetical protein